MPMDLACGFRIYKFPQDHVAGNAALLQLITQPGDLRIADYGFNQPEFADAVKRVDADGFTAELLLDFSQGMGASEKPIIRDLQAALKHGTVVLATAGPDSPKPRMILHDKVAVKADPDGGEDWVWLGSLNFTNNARFQANTAVLFRSAQWRHEVFDPWFDRTRAWALKNIPQQVELVAQWATLWAPEDTEI